MRKERHVMGARWATVTGRAGWLAAMALAFGCVFLVGCETDSFLDPSVVGRWENTPVVMPILDRLDVIDEPRDERPGLSAIRPNDLIPDIVEYRIASGDTVQIEVQDLVTYGSPSITQRRVDELGKVANIPFLGELDAAGLTSRQLERDIVALLEERDLLPDPIVTVLVLDRRERTFGVIGSSGSGSYAILQNNFRLLDAVAMSGGLPPGTEKIYVIRQVGMTDEVRNGRMLAPEGEGVETGDDGETGEESVDDVGALIDDLASGLNEEASNTGAGAGGASGEAAVNTASMEEAMVGGGGDGEHIFVPGRGWVWVPARGSTASDVEVEAGVRAEMQGMMTQRVIEVDAEALQRGEAIYNIVVRPGDVIQVPTQQSGLVYLDGPGIGRRGVFTLSASGRNTVKQIIAAAGGLSAIAIPERVDLVRRIGKNQEATVRINLRAIYEGVQPDFFLRNEDTFNFGTNPYATHLAVIRNSFRFSYGMGFLLDRNFGTDVFGPIQTNNGGF